MSSSLKIKLALAVFLSLIIAVLTFAFLKNYTTDTTIIVALQDINERTWVRPEMLEEVRIRTYEKNILAPNAATSIKDLENAITKVKITKGQVIDMEKDVIAGTIEHLKTIKVITEDKQINDAYFISDNKRIVGIRVDSQGSVNYILKSGDFVDVVYTGGDGQNTFSTTMLKHIEVYSVDFIEDKDKKNGQASQNILLKVTPQEAVDLNFAKRTGKVDLVLNPEDGEDELVSPVNIQRILGK